MRDAKLEPEYVYQENPPEVDEMQCPEGTKLACLDWLTRPEMLRHYVIHHPEYKGTDTKDIEVIFEQERTRRYGR